MNSIGLGKIMEKYVYLILDFLIRRTGDEEAPPMSHVRVMRTLLHRFLGWAARLNYSFDLPRQRFPS
jgi:hypothetical protein